MKKLFLLTIASLMTVFAMATGTGDGSTKANAIDFDWDLGVEHPGGTKWYRVPLTPLYEEDNPSLTLYLTNPSNVVGSSVDVSMKATVAGQTETKDYTIAARQYKTYTANASMLVSMHQTEIYLTLSSTGKIKLSAKVFETADLDETCKDARLLSWDKDAVQDPMYSAWWKVSLKPIKETTGFDAKVIITNSGSKKVNLKVGQSLDCPSSGTTRRDYTLAPGESVIDTIPRSMIMSVQPDEVYFGIENVESQVTVRVEKVAQPPVPIIPGKEEMAAVETHVDPTDTVKTGVPAATAMQGTTIPAGQTLYRFSVKDLNAFSKYEPEFTYRNEGATLANVSIKMAFERPAFGTSNTQYEIPAGEEEIVVYKKNMLDGMEGVDSIFLLTITDQPITFLARYKHVREGKACKTNIDFNWVSGHAQEGRTTQWYAIDVADARDRLKDIIIYVQNEGNASATVKASMAFSCPYIDLQEVTRTIGAKSAPVSRRMGFSSYAMMSDTVWVGLETDQPIKFWADTVDAETKEEVDTLCLHAKNFNWEEGVTQNGGDTVWYLIDMTEVRKLSAKFPTVFVQNQSSTKAAKIDAELSVECPDSIENEKHSLTIAANGSYSKPITRTMFENIVSDEIYLRVVSSEKISLQIRLTEEAEGTSCASAIPFNWTSGNSQAANSNLWYKVNVGPAMRGNYDLNLTIENKNTKDSCSGVGQLTFGCPDDEAPSVQSFKLAPKQVKTLFRPHSALQLLPDSIIYINLQGNTDMRISAEMVTPAAFDQITGPDTSLDTLLIDSKESITQNAAKQWYIIPKEEVQHMRDTIEVVPLTPNIHLENIGDADYDVTIEVAFAFPITETMISQTVKVPHGQAFVHALDYKLFKQAITKFDSVLVRITIPAAAAGQIRIKSGVDKAFNGNTRETASPILVGETYVQDGNTTMWYKLKTADLKKDLSLLNKSLNVRTSNKGNAATTISVAVYEGLQSKVDMLEQFGMGDYRERKIKKGEDRNRSFPFQNILMVADVEFYIQVTTTEKITFSTKVAGEYATLAKIDSTQQEAELLVPNVDYLVPGDNKTHWYQICIPYIRNNYKYTHACSLTYEVEDEATIEALNTFMDTMKYNFPSRKRTINKAKKHYVDTKPLSELLSKGIAKVADQDFDITSFEENFVDSMLHRYVTSDSITMYIRYKTSTDMKVRLNMPKVLGHDCEHTMNFDWEHGNINMAKDTMWVHVKMDSTLVPKGKTLELHMKNLSGDSTMVKAVIHKEDCEGEELLSISRKILEDTVKVFDRQLLVDWGWAGMRIKYYSDSATHIWAEIVDTLKRDTIFDTIPNRFVCPNTIYYDTVNDPHLIDPDDASAWHFTAYKDSTIKSEAKIVTYAYTYNVYPKAEPSLPGIASLVNAPVVTKGAILDCSGATYELYTKLNDPTQSDTIMRVKSGSITWEYCVDGENWLPIPTTALDTAAIALRYNLTTECGDDLTSDYWVNVPVYDIYETACDSFYWDLTGTTTKYTTSQQVMSLPIPINAMIDKYIRLNLTINYSGTGEENVTICASQLPYAWKGQTCTAAGDYTFDTLTTLNCDSVITLHLTVNQPGTGEENITICASQLPYAWKDKTCTAAGDYTFDTLTTLGCDSVITLHLTVNQPSTGEESVTICAAELPYAWKDKTCTAAGDYTFDTLNVLGCDSVITLHLTVNQPSTGDTTAVECDSFDWYGTTYTTSGDYTHTFVNGNILGCDSVLTLHLTINKSVTTTDAVTSCNLYFWPLDSTTYYKSGVYKATGKTVNGCDSTVTLTLTINNPIEFQLDAVAKYGNRLLMINRLSINEKTGWALDSLGANGEAPEVEWWRKDAVTDDDEVAKLVGTGYYITNLQDPGEPLVGVYYATIDLPANTGACPRMKGRTKDLVCVAPKSAAPALMPSLARPGENIRVVNLDPDEETVIRIYTTEGLVQGTYTVSGEESFEMKAAAEHGFYLVEVSNTNIQTTLRYIVK